jgi:preprotein translocase subunit YajC
MALQWTLLPIIVVADCLVAVSMIRMQRRRRQGRSQDFRSMEDAKEASTRGRARILDRWCHYQ